MSAPNFYDIPRDIILQFKFFLNRLSEAIVAVNNTDVRLNRVFGKYPLATIDVYAKLRNARKSS